MITKILAGAGVGLAIVCALLCWRLDAITSELEKANAELAVAKTTIKAQTKEININNAIFSAVQAERDKLLKERAIANDTIKELLARDANSSWANEEIPQDVQDFLNNIQQEIYSE